MNKESESESESKQPLLLLLELGAAVTVTAAFSVWCCACSEVCYNCSAAGASSCYACAEGHVYTADSPTSGRCTARVAEAAAIDGSAAALLAVMLISVLMSLVVSLVSLLLCVSASFALFHCGWSICLLLISLLKTRDDFLLSGLKHKGPKTVKMFTRTLFIGTKRNMRIFGGSPHY